MRAIDSVPRQRDQRERGLRRLTRQPEVAWLMLWLVCVTAMVVFPHWQVQIPLLTTMFVVMAWVAHRRVVASDRAKVAAKAQRLLHGQRQFLQDASHQLRTPITIALGHAELLAADLAGQQRRDIHVVVGELERLRTLSDRLLLIAASEHPDFLAMEPTDLDVMAVDLLRRWQPTAARRWQLGRLDPVRAAVDADRLALALDALVENAVRHTGPDDQIKLEIRRDDEGFALIVVADSGEGIADVDVPHIFERFRTSSASAKAPRGTGLGLALVEAIARGHGGDVSVQTELGQGSTFTLRLPITTGQLPVGQLEPELPAVQGLPEVRSRSVAPGVKQEAS